MGMAVFAVVGKTANRAENFADIGRGRHSVYTLLNQAGDVVYVGRTKRAVDVRVAEHLKRWDDIRLGDRYTGLNKAQARGLEQMLYVEFGGKDVLRNVIPPLSGLHLYKGRYMRAARDYVAGVGGS
jgi:hypothetical protein